MGIDLQYCTVTQPDGTQGIAEVTFKDGSDVSVKELFGCVVHLPVSDTSHRNLVGCDAKDLSKVKYFVFIPWFEDIRPREEDTPVTIEVILHRYTDKNRPKKFEVSYEKVMKYQVENRSFFVVPCDSAENQFPKNKDYKSFKSSSFLRKNSSRLLICVNLNQILTDKVETKSNESPKFKLTGFQKNSSSAKNTRFQEFCITKLESTTAGPAVASSELEKLEGCGVLLIRNKKSSNVVGFYKKEVSQLKVCTLLPNHSDIVIPVEATSMPATTSTTTNTAAATATATSAVAIISPTAISARTTTTAASADSNSEAASTNTNTTSTTAATTSAPAVTSPETTSATTTAAATAGSTSVDTTLAASITIATTTTTTAVAAAAATTTTTTTTTSTLSGSAPITATVNMVELPSDTFPDGNTATRVQRPPDSSEEHCNHLMRDLPHEMLETISLKISNRSLKGWKEVGSILKVCKETLERIETNCSYGEVYNLPGKQLLEHLASSRPYLTVKEFKKALESIKRNDVKLLIEDHFCKKMMGYLKTVHAI